MIAIDGACHRNGKSGAVASATVFFASALYILEDSSPTSQRAELKASIKPLMAVSRIVVEKKKLRGMDLVVVKTDSAYLVGDAGG
jgi:ribonuclease HI